MSGDPMWWNTATGWQYWPSTPNVCCGGGIPQTFQPLTTWPPIPQSLSNADIERIAQRVAELLKEQK